MTLAPPDPRLTPEHFGGAECRGAEVSGSARGEPRWGFPSPCPHARRVGLPAEGIRNRPVEVVRGDRDRCNQRRSPSGAHLHPFCVWKGPTARGACDVRDFGSRGNDHLIWPRSHWWWAADTCEGDVDLERTRVEDLDFQEVVARRERCAEDDECRDSSATHCATVHTATSQRQTTWNAFWVSSPRRSPSGSFACQSDRMTPARTVRPVLVLIVILGWGVACTSSGYAPVPDGPAFTQVSKVRTTSCGQDVCVSIDVRNVGTQAGGGTCRLFKVTSPGKGPTVDGPMIELPSVEPGSTTTVQARWPSSLDPVASGNAFGLSCSPGPSS